MATDIMEGEGGGGGVKQRNMVATRVGCYTHHTVPHLSFDLLGGGGVATSLERLSLSNMERISILWSSECCGQFVDL